LSDKVDRGLVIEPARDGGFVVKEVGGQGYIWPIAFAGKLGECLDYVAAHYSDREDISL
jgi:hypothetical protein